MGYIEDIKKINAMAKELISHGMASSFDEAVQKATKMLGEGADVTHSRDFEPSVHVQQQHPMPKKETEQPMQSQISRQPQQSARDERTGMTWQEAMAKNNEYIVKMLKDFQKQMQGHYLKVAQVESSLQDLAKRHAKLSAMMVSAPKGSEEINIEDEAENNQLEQPKQEPASQSQQPKQEKKEPHPKQGQYSSEDVAVDKMFYFGNK